MSRKLGFVAAMFATSMMLGTVAYASPVHASSSKTTVANRQYLKMIASYDRNLFSQVLQISVNGQKCLQKKITYKAFQTDFKKEYANIRYDLVKIQKTKSPASAKAFKVKYDTLLSQYVSWIGSLNQNIKANRTPVPGSQKRQAAKARYFVSAFKKLNA